MEIEIFNQIKTTQKADLVWEWAYFISCTRYAGYNIAYFSLFDYFAEMYIDIGSSRVDLVRALSWDDLKKDGIHDLPDENKFHLPNSFLLHDLQ